ncbi:MAG: hypothetical protein HZR80_00345 [Candidatus Heimdallarchaeota archaeon]
MDWKACQRSSLVKTIKVDSNLIKSLVKESAKKLRTQNQILLSDESASSKITLAYDAVRMVLDAVAIKCGYKIYNHECFRAFLKEVLKESSLGDEFDKYRKIRNAINYYGKEVLAVVSEKIISELIDFHRKIRRFL